MDVRVVGSPVKEGSTLGHGCDEIFGTDDPADSPAGKTAEAGGCSSVWVAKGNGMSSVEMGRTSLLSVHR